MCLTWCFSVTCGCIAPQSNRFPRWIKFTMVDHDTHTFSSAAVWHPALPHFILSFTFSVSLCTSSLPWKRADTKIWSLSPFPLIHILLIYSTSTAFVALHTPLYSNAIIILWWLDSRCISHRIKFPAKILNRLAATVCPSLWFSLGCVTGKPSRFLQCPHCLLIITAW